MTRPVGRSAAFAAVLKQVALAAPLDVPVLLSGETGSGKSRLAQAIHDCGPRAQQPFVELHCAALPEALIETELFGAVAGAHAATMCDVEGKVAAASCGTLVLDGIADLTIPGQLKVVQFLESKQYYPVGATKPERAQVRVIATTIENLACAVSENRFREDLFCLLHVFPIRVPSLAERREDIADLAAFFCGEACERHGLPLLPISPAAIRVLETAPWLGNVRELASTIERAVLYATGETEQIEPDHVVSCSTIRHGLE